MKNKQLLLTLSIICSTITAVAQSFSIELRHTIENFNCISLCESPDGTYALGNKRFGVGIQILKRTKSGYELAGEIATGNTKFPQHIGIGDQGNVFVVAFTDRSLKLYTRTSPYAFDESQFLTDLDEIPQYIIYNAAKKLFILSDNEHTWIYTLQAGKISKAATIAFGGNIQCFENGLSLLVNEKQYSIKNLQDIQEEFNFESLSFKKLSAGSLDLTAYNAKHKLYALNDDRKLALCKSSGLGYEITCELELPEELESMTFSPDGNYLFGGDDHSDKSMITIWKITEDYKLVQLKQEKGFEAEIENMQVSTDGKFLLTGTNDIFYCYALEGIKGGNIVLQDKKPNNPAKKVTAPVVSEKTEVTPPAIVNNNINIFWINPNPDLLNDKPISTDKPSFEIQIKIISADVVKKEDVIILINGKEIIKNKFNEVSLIPSKASPGNKSDEYTFIKNIPLEGGLNTIEVSTKGKKANKSVQVFYSSAKPSLHVLSIGTSLDLQFPKKDAEDFANLFNKQQGKDKLFQQVHIKKLIGKEATTNAIKEAIEFYKYEYKQGSILPNDVLLIFISSHGFIYQNKFRIQGDDYKDIYKETYSVAYDEIISRLNEIDCKKIIFLDACFSGGAKANPAEINEAIDQLNKQKSGTTTFSSCSNDEYSYEDASWNNGAFTKAIVDACSTGDADINRNGLITLEELYEYIKTRVPKMVLEVKQKSQHPTMPVTDLIKETSIFLVE
ncbi:MAG: caspase family protein [Bacteroidetes bacterium]|nr:caspase family protein [Bacteroidota bacterium]